MTRHDRRQATEERILSALREQLLAEGFRGIGVNAVARRAGVSKELIYRYFGGMDELLHALMTRHDYWSGRQMRALAEPDADAPADPAARVRAMLTGQLRSLLEEPELQEIRRWELVDSNAYTRRLAAERERASLAFMASLDLPEDRDAAGMVGLMLAGVLYLVLRSKTAPSFFGIPLDSEEGWGELERVIATLVERALGSGGPDAAGREDG